MRFGSVGMLALTVGGFLADATRIFPDLAARR
jgi:hypothetical protein